MFKVTADSNQKSRRLDPRAASGPSPRFCLTVGFLSFLACPLPHWGPSLCPDPSRDQGLSSTPIPAMRRFQGCLQGPLPQHSHVCLPPHRGRSSLFPSCHVSSCGAGCSNLPRAFAISLEAFSQLRVLLEHQASPRATSAEGSGATLQAWGFWVESLWPLLEGSGCQGCIPTP